VYLPLDPAYPLARRELMAADAGASVVLTRQAWAHDLASIDAPVLLLDDLPQDAAASLPIVGAPVDPDHLAYLVYTSGSTGRPKGVGLSHRNLDNLMRSQADLFRLDRSDTVLQFASLSFDASIWEFVWALSRGARLVLIDAGARLTDELREVLDAERVTAMLLPPTALRSLSPDGLPDLRVVFAGTEPCSTEIVRRWSSGRRFFNAYGPTETTVYATLWEYEDGAPLPTPTPIGRPVPGATAYILDADLEPVPVGVPGELYVGGEGVGRGYLGRRGLTAERFLADPFSSVAGRRIYRTGDEARFLADGEIQFLGRGDDQVKIRGHRVELGEIETALTSLESIAEAVVIVRGEPSRLVAYVRFVEGKVRPLVTDLRRALQQRLPDFMLPAAFVAIDTWPVTSNGKLDRERLPDPAPQRPGLPTTMTPPRDAVERLLAEVWARLLGLDEVGVHDNFFDLGGHSLLASEVVAAVRDVSPTVRATESS
jgi:amino acid adenylation domain-containing protein